MARVHRRAAWLALALLALSVLLLGVGAGVGASGLSVVSGGGATDPVAWLIVRDIRLPRSLGAWLAGALLGLAGAVAQGLFRNPLADPFLLGSASGASLGVALALARGVQHTLRLLLAGVIVGVVLGALGSLTTLLVPETLPAMQAFMLGSTAFIGWPACGPMAVAFVLCLLLAWIVSPVLDGLSLGEATARSLGLPLGPLRLALVTVMALATGAAVAQAGLIAFVGLAAPHLVRSVVKTTHGRLVALSALAGGVLLLAADLLARAWLAPQELPVGVLTAGLGGGYLLWLMHRGRSSRGAL